MSDIKKLVVSKDPAPPGYSFIGFFNTKKEADHWYNMAIKCDKNYPFWLMHKELSIGNMYVLYWKKPKNSKVCGKGFGGH